MNCKYAEKVSVLIDGELSETESKEIKLHIAGCMVCQDLEKDFLFFRRQIKTPAANEFDQRENARQKKTTFFEKQITLPAPVFSLFILIFLGTIAGYLYSSVNPFQKETVAKKPLEIKDLKQENFKNGTSLARYDKGRKAEIYVVPIKTATGSK